LTHTRSLNSEPGFRAKKRLGQHFLSDPGIIQKIIAGARFLPSDLVLEIGPGLGALTIPLARTVHHVVAVEKDEFLSRLLKEKLTLEGIANVTVLTHDILQFNFHEIHPPPSSKIQVIGNLPYNISSPILEKLLENRELIARSILMFQLEVAKRLTASIGGKAYGAMTVLVQYHAHPTPLLEVSKGAFSPRPKVDSMVLELDFERPYPEHAVHENKFKRVVKGAFAHRRKTLLNSLRGVFFSWDREELLRVMEKCDIDPSRRAETLDIEEFLCLASAAE